eukprot:gene7909-5849_t
MDQQPNHYQGYWILPKGFDFDGCRLAAAPPTGAMGGAQEGQKKQAEKTQATLFETGFSQKE